MMLDVDSCFLNSKDGKEEGQDQSVAPDMCPVEGERVSELPDVITSAQTDKSDNSRGSPSLVYDNSPVTLDEAMDTTDDQDNVLKQSEASSTVDQSLENRSSSDDEPSSKTAVEVAESSVDSQSGETVLDDIKLEIRSENNKTVDVESVNVIAYQSDLDQSVEEKRAKHYSHVTDEESTDIVNDINSQERPNSPQETKDLSEGVEDETAKTMVEARDISEELVEIPLDSDSSGNKEETSEEPRLTSTEKEEVKLTDQNTNDNHSSEVVESSSKPGHVHIHLDNISDFDSFQFWRTPIPQLDLDLDIVDGKPQNIHVKARVKDEEHHKVYASEMNVQVTGDRDVNSNLSDSLSDLTVCDKLDNPVINTNRSESVSEEDGLLIHKASVSTVSETDNLYNSAASTSVAGQNENTLTVIDGVVQGKLFTATVNSENFARTLFWRNFVKIKPSRNCKITLSFIDIGNSCLNREIFTPIICLLMLFAKMKFSRKVPNLQYICSIRASTQQNLPWDLGQSQTQTSLLSYRD